MLTVYILIHETTILLYCCQNIDTLKRINHRINDCEFLETIQLGLDASPILISSYL